MNNKIAGLIPPNSKTVLEIINNDFQTADKFVIKEQYFHINPNCNYEIKDVSEVLPLKKVDTILFETSSFVNLSENAIVSMINKNIDCLKDDGLAIFALENVAYIDNVMAILNEEPLTVKTNLTIRELNKIINQSELTSIKNMKIAKETVAKRAIVEIAKAPLNVSHYIIYAMKKEAAKNLKSTFIQSYLGEVLVCAGIRVNEPNRFMTTKPGVYASATRSGEVLSLAPRDQYDNKIFINQRVSFESVEQGINLFDSIVERNYLIIEEMDDNPVLWQKKYEETKFINFIGVHGIQTSTEPLADFFKQFNPNVKIFENQLSELPPERDFAAELAKHEPVTIFFGALNRDKDFYELLPAINKIAAEYGDNVAFKVIARTQLFDSIESNNKTFVGKKEVYDGQYVPYNIYEQELRTSHISLLPLKDNIFNRSKSDLKFIECAGNGSVVLASPTVYSKTVKDGETGFIYQSIEDFYNKLKILINNHNKRIEIAKNAYNYVKHNRLLSQHYEERLDWYNELIARLPELNKQVYDRLDVLKEKGLSAFGGFKDSDTKLEFRF